VEAKKFCGWLKTLKHGERKTKNKSGGRAWPLYDVSSREILAVIITNESALQQQQLFWREAPRDPKLNLQNRKRITSSIIHLVFDQIWPWPMAMANGHEKFCEHMTPKSLRNNSPYFLNHCSNVLQSPRRLLCENS
jgi:hypothetical protein